MQPNRPYRTVLFLLLFSFTMLPLMLVFVASTARTRTDGGLPPAVAMAISAVAIGGSAYFAFSRMTSDQSKERFQTSMLIALALGELCSLIGFVNQLMGGGSMVPYVVANLGVIFAVILPRVLQFAPE